MGLFDKPTPSRRFRHCQVMSLDRITARGRLRELKGGRFTRRGLIKAFAGGVAATAATGGGAYSALVPGIPIWRLLNDRSLRTFSGYPHWVSSVAVTPDAQQVISGSADKTIKVWELASGPPLAELKGQHHERPAPQTPAADAPVNGAPRANSAYHDRAAAGL